METGETKEGEYENKEEDGRLKEEEEKDDMDEREEEEMGCKRRKE